MSESLWSRCLRVLESELPEQQFNTWLRPLQSIPRDGELCLLAPNHYVIEWVTQNTLPRIQELLRAFAEGEVPQVVLEVGTREIIAPAAPAPATNGSGKASAGRSPRTVPIVLGSRINADFTFDNFVEGKSNQLAKAAAIQVAGNPGKAYNPLFIYGGVGLGKTHLMHAVANHIKERHPDARLAYVHSERFVSDMVKALQHNTINDFKTAYRTQDALMIDDIRSFSPARKKPRKSSFIPFNALLESQQQVILTCDRYPKEVDGLEERLKSRFGWGLTVAIEPPELETCVAILMSKAALLSKVELPEEVAFFIAKRIRSNVRELEGALRRVVATSHFTGRAITLEFAKDALRDHRARAAGAPRDGGEYPENRRGILQNPHCGSALEAPQPLHCAAPPGRHGARQGSSTNHSLPEIGDAFGGRDHTTVLHACRRIKALRETERRISEDYLNLLRTLAG